MRSLHVAVPVVLGIALAAAFSGWDDHALGVSRSFIRPAPPAATLPPQTEACAAPASAPGSVDLAGLVERVGGTVVSVQGMRAVDFSELEQLLDLPPGSHPGQLRRAVGSGVLIGADGLVLTNDHVVEGAHDLEVRLSDDRAFAAKVVGRDPHLDVALLRLQGAAGLPVASMGTSEAVRVGDRTVVIGNPFGLGPSVSLGIVSATAREVATGMPSGYMQTDAAINPGNSGGPVFNAAGEVIGLATAIYAHGYGIGFAIPIDDVREVLPELASTGRVTRGRMGISFQAVSGEIARAIGLDAPAGAMITEIEPGGPAEREGLRPGDVILGFGEARISHARELARALSRHKPGERVVLRYLRGGAERRAVVVLARAEDELETIAEEPTPARGTLGLSASDGLEGARIEALDPRGALARELEVGDVVLEVDGAPIRGAADLAARLRRARPGADLLLRVRREGSFLYLVIQAPS